MGIPAPLGGRAPENCKASKQSRIGQEYGSRMKGYRARPNPPLKRRTSGNSTASKLLSCMNSGFKIGLHVPLRVRAPENCTASRMLSFSEMKVAGSASRRMVPSAGSASVRASSICISMAFTCPISGGGSQPRWIQHVDLGISAQK